MNSCAILGNNFRGSWGLQNLVAISQRSWRPLLTLKAGYIGNNGKNWLLNLGTSSQSERYSSKWLIWLVCREPLNFICYKLHSASPRTITFLLIHNLCNYFPNCTWIHVVTYTNSVMQHNVPQQFIKSAFLTFYMHVYLVGPQIKCYIPGIHQAADDHHQLDSSHLQLSE